MRFDLIHAKGQFTNYRAFPFRPMQEEAIRFALESPKKIVILEAATGSGKSLVGMASLAAMEGGIYLVHSKVLQNQITGDFPEAKSLFGRSNYQCLLNPDYTCEDCRSGKHAVCEHHVAYKKIYFPKEGESEPDCDPCIYKEQKAIVLGSKYKILNYDYFLSETNYIGRFSGHKFVVVDEADSLENTLIGFVTLTFTRYALRRIGMDEEAAALKMTSKYRETLISSWIEFGKQALFRVTAIIKKLDKELELNKRHPDQFDKISKELKAVVRLEEKIKLFLDNVDDTWMLDNQTDKLIFRPLWITPTLAENFLWKHAGKFVLMSASFYPRPILAKCLGLDVDDLDYHMVPCQFPVANRPIYVHPAVNLTAKTMDVEVPKLMPAIRQIASARPTVKGIIHAVSYSLSHRIVDALKDPRFITHNSDDRQSTLDQFMASDEPLILVSPSLERGVSLAEDLCRLIIIAKAPYLSLGDKVVAARLYSSKLGSDWYKSTMMLTVLQMAGRGVRSATDFAECFILDDQVNQAILSRPGFLPPWWVDAVEFRLPLLKP